MPQSGIFKYHIGPVRLLGYGKIFPPTAKFRVLYCLIWLISVILGDVELKSSPPVTLPYLANYLVSVRLSGVTYLISYWLFVRNKNQENRWLSKVHWAVVS